MMKLNYQFKAGDYEKMARLFERKAKEWPNLVKQGKPFETDTTLNLPTSLPETTIQLMKQYHGDRFRIHPDYSLWVRTPNSLFRSVYSKNPSRKIIQVEKNKTLKIGGKDKGEYKSRFFQELNIRPDESWLEFHKEFYANSSQAVLSYVAMKLKGTVGHLKDLIDSIEAESTTVDKMPNSDKVVYSKKTLKFRKDYAVSNSKGQSPFRIVERKSNEFITDIE